MLYYSWDMVHDGSNHFSFWAIFCPFTPQQPKKPKFEMKKTPGDIIILHTCTKNYDQMMYGSWDMVHDRQTDRRKKWHIEVGAPTKNQRFFDVCRRFGNGILAWRFIKVVMNNFTNDCLIFVCSYPELYSVGLQYTVNRTWTHNFLIKRQTC